jgi:translation initiation factor IF-3
MEINKPINENINASELLVIDEAGKKIGVLKLEEAIKKAKAKKKDLILINEGKNGQLSVAKIDDYKRYLYMQKIKNKEAKKSIGSNKVKEMKIKPQISDYDIN